MKRLLFLLFCALTLNLFAQDTKPTNPEFKMLQAPNTPIFWYNPIDSFVWVYKGTYGWTRLLGETRAAYKYVPYNGATKQVDLGYQRITSKKQLLPLFNGACSIPTILDNGDGSITVGDGEYHLSTRTDGKGTESFLISGGVFTLTDNTTNYLVADYNSGTPILKVITDVNLINETTVIPIYTAYRSGTVLHFQNWDALGVALANKVHQSIVKTQRYRRESGLGISEFPTRYLSIGNGKVWVGAVPVTLDAITTNTDNLRLFYHSGGVWTYSLQTQYNNSQYDDGTNLVTLTANRYAVNWIFRGVESQKHLYVVLGRGDYTLAQAQDAVLPSVPAIISSHATLIGKLIVQRDATTATSIQSAFDVQFSTATPNAHNDLTGRDVADVHPAGSITFTPTGTYTATTVADALAQIDSKTVDRSITNELQTLSTTSSGTTRTITISSGNSVGIDIADNDNNSTNEIQDLSGSGATLSGYQISLSSDATPVTLPSEADGSTTNEIQAPTLVGDNIGLTQTTTTISIAGKEDKSNKVTSISSSSTDIQYPSAKLLYDQLALKAPASGSGSYIQNQNSSAQSGNAWIDGFLRSSSILVSQTTPSLRAISTIGTANSILELGNIAGFDGVNAEGAKLYYSGSTGNTFLDSYYSGGSLNFRTSVATTPILALSINNSGAATFASNIQATTAKLTNLTDGYIPYHISDASGLDNSVLKQTAGSLSLLGGAYKGSYFEHYKISSLDATAPTQLIFAQTATNDWSILSVEQGVSYRNIVLNPNGGNVGIGYSTGTEITNNKLAVNGSGYFNGNINASGELQSSSSIRYNGYAFSSNEFRFMLYDGSWYQNIIANQGVFQSTVNSIGYLLNGNNLFGSLSSNTLMKWDGTKAVSVSNGIGLPSNDGNGNFTYWNQSVQSLSGTITTWTTTNGVNAKITITAATTIYMTGLVSGQTGNITITNPSTAYKLKFTGYTLKISPALTADSGGILLSGSSKTDVLSWYYDGDYVIINGTLSYQSFSY